MLTSGSVLALTVVAGFFGLPLLRRLQVGQIVRDDGPASHFSKSGTPTFGGLFFLLPVALLGIYALFEGRLVLARLVLLMLLFAATGFIDDFIKVKVSRAGLSVRLKSLLMGVISLGFAVHYLYLAREPAFFLLPVTGSVIEIEGMMRLPYLLFVVLYLFFISNSVNLTDGVDGLAASVTALCCFFLAVCAWLLPDLQVSGSEIGSFALAVVAGCLGFLVYNRHPARVFMGDTGSQALGAAVAGIALLLGIPWILLFAGIIYIIESFSVMIQVAYFKKTGGRRIFRMSPLHHHFELGGWPEKKIVLVFTLVTLLGGLVSLALI